MWFEKQFFKFSIIDKVAVKEKFMSYCIDVKFIVDMWEVYYYIIIVF